MVPSYCPAYEHTATPDHLRQRRKRGSQDTSATVVGWPNRGEAPYESELPTSTVHVEQLLAIPEKPAGWLLRRAGTDTH